MAAHTAFQGVLEGFLPWPLFDALEAGTRTFVLECPCGERRDLWEAGGVKGNGNPEKTLARCQVCGGLRWHLKRKKTPEERVEFLPGEGTDVVLLSSHAWWASLLTWGTAALVWSAPIFTGTPGDGTLGSVAIWGGTWLLGWIAPFFWMTTRYRFGRHTLQLRSGCFGRDLDPARITGVRTGRDRKWITVSFAFDTGWMTVEYPSRFGGYSVSPKDRELFLRLLAERCPHLERVGDELLPGSRMRRSHSDLAMA